MAGATGGHVGLAERAFGRRLAQLEEGDADLAPAAPAAAGNRVAGSLSFAALRIAVGREAHRGAGRRRPVSATACVDLAEQADAVLDRTAIIVVAQIGAVAQELVDQIAIGGVDLDAVEAGGQRIGARRRHSRSITTGNFVEPQRAGLGIRLAAVIGVRLVGRGGGRGGDRLAAVEEARDGRAGPYARAGRRSARPPRAPPR